MNPHRHRPRSIVVLLTAMTVASTVQAQTPPTDFATPPAPTAPRPLRIAPPSEQRLPNGLRVVLAERRGVQLVTAQLLVLSGSAIDPPQLAGLAATTAALLTKGTRHHSAPALARAAESLGGSLESAAGPDSSQLAITVAVPQLDAALGLVAEAAREPRFEQTELDRSRSQSLDELKLAYARPGTLAVLASQHLLYGNGAYGRPSAGTPASLKRITRADLQTLHAATFRPDNAVLLLAGDVDAATALQLAERHFGGWRLAPGAAAAPSPVVVDSNAVPVTSVLVDVPQAGQAAVVVSTAMPPLAPADRATAAVLNEVLGGGFSSRLNQEVRIKRGLSYGAGSQVDARRSAATLRVVVQTKNPSAAEVVGLIQGELDRLVASPVEAGELEARKAALIGGFSRGVETTAGLGSAVAGLIVAGLPPASLGERIPALAAVGPAELQALAAQRLAPTQRRVVVAGDAASIAASLMAARPGTVRIPAAALTLDGESGLSRP